MRRTQHRPDRVEQVGARQQPADVLEKQGRDFEFLLRQLDHGAVFLERTSLEIDAKRSGFDRRFPATPVPARATQQRFEPGEKLHPPQGFDQIVVGPALERVHDVFFAIAPRGEEDRQGLAHRLADRLDDFLAAQVGHLPVEHHEVEGVPQHRAQDFLATVEVVADIALRRDPVLQQLGLGGIILQNRDPVGSGSRPSASTGRHSGSILRRRTDGWSHG